VVLLSVRSAKLDRLLFTQVAVCAVVVSVVFATTATMSVFATVVVAPGIENDALAVEATPPFVTSQGLPGAKVPWNALIRPIIWSDEVAVAVGAN
jgi:hypothetical protein